MRSRRSFLLLAGGAMLVACGPRPSAGDVPPPAAPATLLRVSGSGTALPAVQKLGEGYESIAPDVRLEFPGGTNSGGAIRGVLDGTLDVAVTNRPLSDAEASQPLTYLPFARDAVAFAVHRSVSIQKLGTPEVRELYTGRAKRWLDVGGPDKPVILLDRDEDESMRKLTLVPLMERQAVAEATTLTSASDMLAALDTTPYAIGYTSLGLLRLRAPKNVVPIMLDDVTPNVSSVASGAYPWSLTFGLVVRSDAPPATQAFVKHVVASARRVLSPFEYEALDG